MNFIGEYIVANIVFTEITDILEVKKPADFPAIEGSVFIQTILTDMGIEREAELITPPELKFSDLSSQEAEDYIAAYNAQAGLIWEALVSPKNQQTFYTSLLAKMKTLPINTDANISLAKIKRKTILNVYVPELKVIGIKPNQLKYFETHDNTIDHYFLYYPDSGEIIDLLQWVADVPYSTDTGIDIISSNSSGTSSGARSNPYDPDTYSSDQTPLILWIAVRSVFLMGEPRRAKESTHSYITRLFRLHKIRDGETRKDSVGRAYAIAIKTLQKKGYLKKGKRSATKKGLEQGMFLIETLGSDEIERRFHEFEEILNLSQGKRYVNY